MKKTILTSAVFIISFAASAQQAAEPLIDRSLVFDIVNICGALTVVYLLTNFILQITKRNFDHRLKNKILEKETPENIAQKVLQSGDKPNDQHFILQWIFVLCGIGIGITITHLSRPIGLHSIAIMAFSVAAGLLGYHLLTRKKV